MDKKNLEALTSGPEWMLTQFANLPYKTKGSGKLTASKLREAVAGFIRRYGELYPGWDASAELLYIHYSDEFRKAWHARTKADKEAVSQLVTGIFERDRTAETMGLIPAPSPFDDPNDPEHRPAVIADFESGKITLKPRTLLDWLAKSLLDYGDKLAICERNVCEHPYFVKTHARQRFCSHDCANSVRELKKERWWAENRDRFLRKWRRERKAIRQRKRRKSFKRDAPLRKQ